MGSGRKKVNRYLIPTVYNIQNINIGTGTSKNCLKFIYLHLKIYIADPNYLYSVQDPYHNHNHNNLKPLNLVLFSIINSLFTFSRGTRRM